MLVPFLDFIIKLELSIASNAHEFETGVDVFSLDTMSHASMCFHFLGDLLRIYRHPDRAFMCLRFRAFTTDDLSQILGPMYKVLDQGFVWITLLLVVLLQMPCHISTVHVVKGAQGTLKK